MTNTSVINMLHNDFITCGTIEFVSVSILTSQFHTFCKSIRKLFDIDGHGRSNFLLIHCADYTMVFRVYVTHTTRYVLFYRSASAVDGLSVEGI